MSDWLLRPVIPASESSPADFCFPNAGVPVLSMFAPWSAGLPQGTGGVCNPAAWTGENRLSEPAASSHPRDSGAVRAIGPLLDVPSPSLATA